MTVVLGWDGIESAGVALDALHEATGVHLMGRRTWLRACARHDDTYQPVGVLVPAEDGGLAAAALLGVRRRAGVREYVALGHGISDATALPARTPAAADALAAETARLLEFGGGPWRLTLRHLPESDAVAQRLAAVLPRTRITPDEVSPRLLMDPARNRLRDYVSKHYVKNRRRGAERLAELGTPVEVGLTLDAAEITSQLPAIARICRERDREMNRVSIVDAPAGGRFFADVVADHAAREEILLLTCRVGTELAGYALCLFDRDVVRVWNCRFDPRWGSFGIGQICRASLIEHAIAKGLHSVDWLLGDEPYKAGLSNDRVPAADLFASSNVVLATATDLALRVRADARRATEDDAAPPRWVRAVRTLGRPLLGS